MFSNLASYLGYAAPSAKSQAENVPAEVRLRAVEEDDWVLVERNENERSMMMKKEVDEDSEMARVTLAASTCPGSLPVSSKGLSRSASLDILNPLQESWYLTPPPSFTSEGPVHMETSPLENLLIEHPSMSVYQHSESAESPQKMSNSSPSSTTVSEEEHPVLLLPVKERMYKLPRNKLNVKLSKKQSPTSPSVTAPVQSETEETSSETKEPKMKNFVKSPRRSMNSELQGLPKKPLRRRPETLMGTEMISKTSTSNDVIREEESPVVPNVQTRRLYSEVLASKPKVPAVQKPQSQSPPPPPPPAKVEAKPEPKSEPESTPAPSPVISESQEAAPTENESVMSVEEEEEESSEESSDRTEDRDRRKAVQTLPDRQHRLHFLNRSAQKVEQRKTCDLMKKNPLIRTNKAREINFRNKRQRRADMMQRHSGANNNRKCAKTSLY